MSFSFDICHTMNLGKAGIECPINSCRASKFYHKAMSRKILPLTLQISPVSRLTLTDKELSKTRLKDFNIHLYDKRNAKNYCSVNF